MKFRINKDGFLEIFRGSQFSLQYCPFNREGICGDWCPHFGEPIMEVDEIEFPGAHTEKEYKEHGKPRQLYLCHGTQLWTESGEFFEDLRGSNEKV